MTSIIVIGGGPGGIAAAREAGRLGAVVTLVEREHVGGRATWHSLLPSKVWLTAADRLGARARDARLGLAPAADTVDFETLTEHIATLSATRGEQYSRALAAANVQTVQGAAAFVDAHRVRVSGPDGDTTLDADAVIIATGSGPRFLPQVKPDGKRIIAPRLMGHLTALPRSLVMLGAGVTGAEFAYLFNRLGVDVTWVTDLPEILPLSDADIKGHLQDTLAARGVEVLTSSPVTAAVADDDGVTVTLAGGRELAAEMAFIAIGRMPHVDGLTLDAAGLPAALTVDAFGQTQVASIYAVGDVAGAPMTANKAMAQGYIAARHALGQPVDPYRPETVVEAVYTAPQVAQVGLTEKAAADRGQPVTVIRHDYASNLKAQLDDSSSGLVKLLIAPEDDRLLGGAAVGDHAADVLAPVAVALKHYATLSDLPPVFAGHPTLSELVFDAVRSR